MGNFGRNDNRGGGFGRGGFNRGGDRGGRSSFGGRGGGFGRSDDRGPREMFKTTCSNCGKDCEVPFRPTNGKPVYCSDCFEKMGNSSPAFRPQAQPQPVVNSNSQLEALNAKLDKIISLLEQNLPEQKHLETKSVEPIEAESTETPKEKRTTKKPSKK